MNAKPRCSVALAALAVALLGACGGGGAPADASGSQTRPHSPAQIGILSPRNGEVVHGDKLSVRLSLRHGRIVPATTTDIEPDKGHVHVSLDGSIVSMNYGLRDTISGVEPGTHTLRVEFVASDHLPFDPRVFQEVAFQVKP